MANTTLTVNDPGATPSLNPLDVNKDDTAMGSAMLSTDTQQGEDACDVATGTQIGTIKVT